MHTIYESWLNVTIGLDRKDSSQQHDQRSELLSEAIQKLRDHILEHADMSSFPLHLHPIAKNPTALPAEANNLISLEIYSALRSTQPSREG
jgi:hypothetical protein